VGPDQRKEVIVKFALVSALSAALLLSGCGKIIGIAIQAEQERLAELRSWEASLAEMDCGGLDDEYAGLVKIKDDLVDFDQRQDIMRDAMTGKSCALPDGLA